MITPNESTLAGLAPLDTLAKNYSKARQLLAERVGELEAEVAALQRRRIEGIKSAATAAAALHEELRAAVEAAPDLFQKPKTFTLHGITVGYRKGAGKVVWDDDGRTVALIRKHFPEDQAEMLIIVEERPSADALAKLDGRELARVGARLEGTGEQVIVKDAASAIDKMVARILKEGAREAAGEGGR